MNLNVFNFSFRKSYYLAHPWKWIKELWGNLRAAWMRATKGYCYMDAWEFCDWWPRVTVEVLRHLANNTCSWPDGKFESFEAWTDWLHSVSDILESTLEENWDGQNEYEEDWHNIVMEDLNKHSNITMTSTYTAKDKETIRKLYWDREIELEQKRLEIQQDCLKQITEKLPMIWD